MVRENFSKEVTFEHRMYADNSKEVSHMKKAPGRASQAKGTARVKALKGKKLDIEGRAKRVMRLRWSK